MTRVFRRRQQHCVLGLEELAHHLLVGRPTAPRSRRRRRRRGGPWKRSRRKPNAPRSRSAVCGRTAPSSTSCSSRDERRLGRLDPHLRVLALGASVVADSEHADQRRQRQPLQDERGDDHREREKDDQPAVGERGRQGERGDEGDGAADPDPREQRRQLPGWIRVALADRRDGPAREIGEDRHRHEPHRDHGHADDGGVAGEPGRGGAGERVHDPPQLQADEDEEQRVDDEDEDLPESVPGEPRALGRQLGCVPAHVDADRDGGQHAGDAGGGRRKIREVAAEHGDRHLDRRVVDTAAHLPHDPADPEPDRDPAGDVQDDPARRVEQRERSADGRADRGLVEHERGSVVDEALALDDRDDPPRRAQARRDLGRRERVGRRHDRPEREGDGPRKSDPRVRDDRNRDHRRGHEPERQQRDRPLVRAQVAQRGEERAGVEERRQDGHEHDVRGQRDLRQTGDEAHHDAAEHEQDRQRQPQRRREREQRTEGHEQPEQLEILVRPEVHAGIFPDRAGVGLRSDDRTFSHLTDAAVAAGTRLSRRQDPPTPEESAMSLRRWIAAGAAAFAVSLAAAAGASPGAVAAGCRTAGLVVWLNTQGNAAAGSVYYTLEFTNQSGHTCTLDGYPGVSAIDLHGRRLGSAGSRNPSTAHVVSLANGATAGSVLRIVVAGNYPPAACHRVAAAGLRVYPPNQTASKMVPIPFEACSRTGPGILSVKAVAS